MALYILNYNYNHSLSGLNDANNDSDDNYDNSIHFLYALVSSLNLKEYFF